MRRPSNHLSHQIAARRSFGTSAALGITLFGVFLIGPGGPSVAQTPDPCLQNFNAVVCENQKPGDPSSDWDISGAGDPDLQGFTTDISVDQGQTVFFKIDTTASAVQLDIYRLGYYGGFGARKVATIPSSDITETNQPSCLTDSATGLVDCGNWTTSASWTVPTTATSGIYFAKATRADTGGASHIFFIVRDDDGRSDLLFQTSDTTWQAYNRYGGNSLYVGNPVGRAYKVSYNRPFTTREYAPEDWVFNAEYPMVRWLEANGFNVSYSTDVDTDRRGAELLEHKVFLSVGHDEYWSGQQRANVETARGQGVHLAFFSGNELFWKTRWESSISPDATPNRTLVSYKETHANAKIDPLPNVWTGTWRDPRFSPPADGGRPENALTGTIFFVNTGTSAIRIPEAEGKMRFWRNTAAANLAPGAALTMPNGTLGYEWDEDQDNGFRPAGLIRMSDTTVSNVSYLQDFGSTYGPGTANHALTLYKHSSGALVFGAGTIQWAWGLDSNHDRGSQPPSNVMQQATVNLFADMGVQPQTLQVGLVTASPSTDTLAPTSTISSPSNGASVPADSQIIISGAATDSGGVVGGVELSVDGGLTWRRATGRQSWTFVWQTGSPRSVTIFSRAVDDSGNLEQPVTGVAVTVGSSSSSCPCTIWPSSQTPTVVTEQDGSAVELGVKFRSSVSGFITGLRFYKGPQNTSVHVGNLWTSGGTLLSSATFTGESASGWQTVTLPEAIAITANTIYVASYHTTTGFYSTDAAYFATAGFIRQPLEAVANGVSGGNGVYRYGASGFPTETYNSTNYWVDVVFTTSLPPDSTPPTVVSVSPANGTGSVNVATSVNATFSEQIDTASITSSTFRVVDPVGSAIAGTLGYDVATRTATLQPTTALNASTTYTATLLGGPTGIKDLSGLSLATDYSWTFTTGSTPPPSSTCPCTIWPSTQLPAVLTEPDANAAELGVKFRSSTSGYITGLRFYKGPQNNGVHVGNLWTIGGTLLSTATFTGESASGWQTVMLPEPVAVTANTLYVASYHTSAGFYSTTEGYFATSFVSGPLEAVATGVSGGNGVYRYGASGFPTVSFNDTNYWVDVVFATSIGPDTTPPTVVTVAPPNGASGVPPTAAVAVSFSENVTNVSAATFEVRDPGNVLVAGTVSYATAARTAQFVPSSPFAYSTAYTARLRGGTGGIADSAGNTLAADYTWTFTIAAPPPPPPTEGPGGPILVVSSTANPFTRYYAEILRNEGLNAFTATDVSQLTASVLSAYDVVILGEMPLTSAQVTLFSDWVTAGGNLIAMRPSKSLAPLLGLVDADSTLSEGYMRVDTTVPPGTGIVGETMQFHGVADLYSVNGAAAVAQLYSNASTGTPNPAVTLRSVGGNGGQAAAFTYDLARSVIFMRQGNPAWAGQERDGIAPIRSDDLFFGGTQADWIDLNKVAIPQADEQQRLLANLINHVNSDRRPLPRFWYFPRGEKAAVVMTGDDHASNGTVGRFDIYKGNSPANCRVDDWECVRATSYIYPSTPITDVQAATYNAEGFEIAVHITTNCQNYTPTLLDTSYANDLGQFANLFPSLPAPNTNRTHCIPWSDFDTQPQVALARGIRLDTNYYYFPGGWVQNRPGFMTGSGMPMRFSKADGTMIDVYQAATQMTDESNQSWPFTIDTLLDRALGPEGYYGYFTANMHTDFVAHVGSEAIVASALARSVPIISAKQLLTWIDGRNGSSFANITWNGGTLSFTISVATGANGLEAMLQTMVGSLSLTGITRSGVVVPHRVETIKGVTYAIFTARAGAYDAVYGVDTTPPAITNVTATPSTTSAAVTWATNEGATSRVDYGLAPDALTATATSPGLSASHSVLLSGLSTQTTYYYRVTSTDGSGNTSISPAAAGAPASFTTTPPPSFNCPCTIWPSSNVPTVVTEPDGSAVELGVKFRSSVDGYVSGIRFYKGPQNTGTHVGNLWTSNGTLLATAIFSGESASGWQTVTFSQPVPITANTFYVASYHAPFGFYSLDVGYFGTGRISGPLEAPSSGTSGGNGVFGYGPSSFPTQTDRSTNYWVDVIFVTSIAPDTTAPTVVAVVPSANATNVSVTSAVSATFNEGMDASTITGTTIQLRDAGSNLVAATVSYAAATRTATLQPSGALASNTTYTATVRGGATGVKDVSGNALASDFSWTFTTGAPSSANCPCTIWPSSAVPTVVAEPDGNAVELGVKFRPLVNGFITEIRFYKGQQNTGTHIGNLWASDGTLLSTATFTGESATGWQTVTLSQPVPVTASTVYVASYHTSSGFYSLDRGYFTTARVSGPLEALSNDTSGGNGVFRYGASGFPSSAFNSTNYWVDVVFVTSVGPDTTPPTVTAVTPLPNATGVSVATPVTVTFSEPVDANTITATTFELRNAGGTLVPGTLTYNATSRTATLQPNADLAVTTTYTARVRGGVSGVKDAAGNPLANDTVWSFTTGAAPACPCSIWSSSDVPAIAAEQDSSAVELGVKFRSSVDGFITGLRFYKSTQNVGVHTANLWTSTGTLLATATFTSETAQGWQQVAFSQPVAITAGTVYVASYHTTSGFYSSTAGDFNAARINGPLEALASGASGGNGVYLYGTGGFPAGTWNATNYWVDVVFVRTLGQ